MPKPPSGAIHQKRAWRKISRTPAHWTANPGGWVDARHVEGEQEDCRGGEVAIASAMNAAPRHHEADRQRAVVSSAPPPPTIIHPRATLGARAGTIAIALSGAIRQTETPAPISAREIARPARLSLAAKPSAPHPAMASRTGRRGVARGDRASPQEPASPRSQKYALVSSPSDEAPMPSPAEGRARSRVYRPVDVRQQVRRREAPHEARKIRRRCARRSSAAKDEVDRHRPCTAPPRKSSLAADPCRSPRRNEDTSSVITSCMILAARATSVWKPMRLAGTWQIFEQRDAPAHERRSTTDSRACS